MNNKWCKMKQSNIVGEIDGTYYLHYKTSFILNLCWATPSPFQNWPSIRSSVFDLADRIHTGSTHMDLDLLMHYCVIPEYLDTTLCQYLACIDANYSYFAESSISCSLDSTTDSIHFHVIAFLMVAHLEHHLGPFGGLVAVDGAVNRIRVVCHWASYDQTSFNLKLTNFVFNY